MGQNVIYAGVDVDDVRYHVSALDRSTGEVLDFHRRASLQGLAQRLEKVREYFGAGQLKLCYEASYVGFSLQRELADRGHCCDVVTASSIPRRLSLLLRQLKGLDETLAAYGEEVEAPASTSR